MENNLDFVPPNDQNLRKAKTTFHLIAALYVLAVSLPFLYVFLPLLNASGVMGNILKVLMGITLLIIISLSPLALFYIVKSYLHKEEKKVQKLLYLIGILFFNAFFIFCVIRFVISIQEKFLYTR